jgi:hypothetical protein
LPATITLFDGLKAVAWLIDKTKDCIPMLIVPKTWNQCIQTREGLCTKDFYKAEHNIKFYSKLVPSAMQM